MRLRYSRHHLYREVNTPGNGKKFLKNRHLQLLTDQILETLKTT